MTDVPELHATGPVPPGRFSHALRSAIKASGLSLNRIQYRLRERGAAVSSATLSYWQSGRRRPTRHDSLLVVRQLEEILRMPAGTPGAPVEAPRAGRPGGAGGAGRGPRPGHHHHP